MEYAEYKAGYIDLLTELIASEPGSREHQLIDIEIQDIAEAFPEFAERVEIEIEAGSIVGARGGRR